MVKRHIYIMLILISSMTCCHRGSNVTSLNKYYYFHDSGGQYKDILRKKDQYYLSEAKINDYLTKIILPSVISFDHNRNFIIVAQEPSFELHKKALVFELSDIYNESKSRLIADSLLHHSQYYKDIFSREINYWIIDAKCDTLYGPYDMEDFEDWKSKLNIPNRLILDIDSKKSSNWD